MRLRPPLRFVFLFVVLALVSAGCSSDVGITSANGTALDQDATPPTADDGTAETPTVATDTTGNSADTSSDDTTSDDSTSDDSTSDDSTSDDDTSGSSGAEPAPEPDPEPADSDDDGTDTTGENDSGTTDTGATDTGTTDTGDAETGDTDTGNSGTSGADLEADVQTARQLLLTGDDVSIGWLSQARDEDDDGGDQEDLELMRSLPGCNLTVAHLDSNGGETLELFEAAPAREESPTWVRNQNELEFTVNVYANPEEATDRFQILDDTDYVGCMVEFFPAGMERVLTQTNEDGPEITLGQVEVSEFDFAGGDQFLGIRVIVPFTVEETEFTIVFELGAIRRGRYISSVSYQRFDDEYTTADDILPLMESRMVEVLGG